MNISSFVRWVVTMNRVHFAEAVSPSAMFLLTGGIKTLFIIRLNCRHSWKSMFLSSEVCCILSWCACALSQYLVTGKFSSTCYRLTLSDICCVHVGVSKIHHKFTYLKAATNVRVAEQWRGSNSHVQFQRSDPGFWKRGVVLEAFALSAKLLIGFITSWIFSSLFMSISLSQNMLLMTSL